MTIDIGYTPWEGPSDAYDVYGTIQALLHLKDGPDLTQENLWTVCLDRENLIVNLELVSMCDYVLTASIPAEIFSVPLQKKAYGFVMAHSSPSGVLEPTEEDIDITDRLIQIGNILNIKVLDHLIVTPDAFYSFQDSGLMDELRKSMRYAIPSLEIGRSVQQEVDAKRRKYDQSKLIDQQLEKQLDEVIKLD